MTDSSAFLARDLELLFREVFGDETIVLTDEYSARDRDDWDSIANINLMFSIEQRFGVRFNGSEFNRLADVAALTLALKGKLDGHRS